MLDDDQVTGQVHFDSHVVKRVEVAAALVNALAIEHAGGRAVAAPGDPDELRARAQEALRAAGPPRAPLDPDAATGLRRLAAQLHDVFAALDDSREDDAAEALNALLARSRARPHLHREPPEPWRLHFHGPDADLVEGWTAGCAMGLAYVLTSDNAARLGTCAAPACDRVFLDLSRNGSRRFCATACQNRVKAAAYRARQRA